VTSVAEPSTVTSALPGAALPILAGVNVDAVSEAARRESRNREVHLPPLSTFRWWARRTGAVNEAVLDAAAATFGQRSLDVLDPFAGGGTIPLVALALGHRVHGQDLNPWAAAGIQQMLALPAAEELRRGFDRLRELAVPLLARAYATVTPDGEAATLAHTYRVAVGACGGCGRKQRLFPYGLLTLLQRKERRRPEAVLACRRGHVFFGNRTDIQTCLECSDPVDPTALYTPRRKFACPDCGHVESLSDRASRAGWGWEIVLVERALDGRREFGLPTEAELLQATRWPTASQLGSIPNGSETKVLLRHGFRDWADLYPSRQVHVTESLLRLAEQASTDRRVVAALRFAIVGTTEFAGHLCRWDRFYLKCNDATAGHRFNFSTFVPELNVWGVGSAGRGTVTRRVYGMYKSQAWLKSNGVMSTVSSEGEETERARIVCGDSAHIRESSRYDLVLTDPPYHDDVHYEELSLPFRAWAGLPLANLVGEATANRVVGRNTEVETYAASLERIFTACRRALRPHGRLVFSFANHNLDAWAGLLSALHRSGFHAVACVSVHSENETDFKKRDVNSCTSDLLLELSPAPLGFAPRVLSEEASPLMKAVVELFCAVGESDAAWTEGVVEALRAAVDIYSGS
jgi:putative DNA methylase